MRHRRSAEWPSRRQAPRRAPYPSVAYVGNWWRMEFGSGGRRREKGRLNIMRDDAAWYRESASPECLWAICSCRQAVKVHHWWVPVLEGISAHHVVLAAPIRAILSREIFALPDVSRPGERRRRNVERTAALLSELRFYYAARGDQATDISALRLPSPRQCTRALFLEDTSPPIGK